MFLSEGGFEVCAGMIFVFGGWPNSAGLPKTAEIRIVVAFEPLHWGMGPLIGFPCSYQVELIPLEELGRPRVDAT